MRGTGRPPASPSSPPRPRCRARRPGSGSPCPAGARSGPGPPPGAVRAPATPAPIAVEQLSRAADLRPIMSRYSAGDDVVAALEGQVEVLPFGDDQARLAPGARAGAARSARGRPAPPGAAGPGRLRTCIPSPTLMPWACPHSVQTVGRWWRTESWSSMSSWIREKLCSSSRATAAGIGPPGVVAAGLGGQQAEQRGGGASRSGRWPGRAARPASPGGSASSRSGRPPAGPGPFRPPAVPIRCSGEVSWGRERNACKAASSGGSSRCRAASSAGSGSVTRHPPRSRGGLAVARGADAGDLLQRLPEVGPQIVRATQRQLDRRPQVAELRAAVVAPPGVLVGVDRAPARAARAGRP